MSRLKELIHEIHRRSLWQVLGIYLASSWVVFEVVQTLTEGVGLPAWVPPAALVALLVGLPIVLATAFVQEGMGGRVERTPTEVEPASTEDDLPAGESAPVSKQRSDGGLRHRLFTWRNALLGGAAAFMLLGVATAGYMSMRTLGIGPAATLISQGVLEKRDTLVLADFQGPDSVLAATTTESFRIDLEQSPALKLLSPARRREAVRRMERDPGATLPLEAARELARREGLKAAIGGSVQPVGSGYLLTARLVAAERGEPLLSVKENASDEGELIVAIDRLSKKLRERVGESLGSIRGSRRLAQATTSSLEALELYTRGTRAFERVRYHEAARLLEAAVEVDTAFAYAYRKLGVTLRYLGRRGPSRDAFRHAYAHRDRLTERERAMTEGTYHYVVRGDPGRAVEAYEEYLARRPDAPTFSNLGWMYFTLRRYERAEEVGERLIEEERLLPRAYDLTAAARSARGDLEGAADAVRRMRGAVGEDDPVAFWSRSQLAYHRGRYDRADSLALEALRELSGAWPRATSYGALAALRALRGQLAEADSLNQRMIDVRQPVAGPHARVSDALHRGRIRLFVGTDTAGALAAVGEALKEVRADTLGPWDLPHDALAAFYALSGEPGAARRHLARRQGALDRGEGLPVDAQLWREIARGALALSVGRFSEAVVRFETALEMPAAISCGGEACALALLALAHRKAGETEGELDALERYVSGQSNRHLEWDALFLAPAHERLGQVREQRGDLEEARLHYAKFTELWADADPELQPRVEAARARLEAILAERG